MIKSEAMKMGAHLTGAPLPLFFVYTYSNHIRQGTG